MKTVATAKQHCTFDRPISYRIKLYSWTQSLVSQIYVLHTYIQCYIFNDLYSRLNSGKKNCRNWTSTKFGNYLKRTATNKIENNVQQLSIATASPSHWVPAWLCQWLQSCCITLPIFLQTCNKKCMVGKACYRHTIFAQKSCGGQCKRVNDNAIFFFAYRCILWISV